MSRYKQSNNGNALIGTMMSLHLAIFLVFNVYGNWSVVFFLILTIEGFFKKKISVFVAK